MFIRFQRLSYSCVRSVFYKESALNLYSFHTVLIVIVIRQIALPIAAGLLRWFGVGAILHTMQSDVLRRVHSYQHAVEAYV